MITTEYVRLMAAYSHWQNRSVYDAASGLSDADRRAERGAFFGSIHATLNHLLWADQVWLHRLAGARAPSAADIPSSIRLHDEWDALREAREETDHELMSWSQHLKPEDLHGDLTWHSGAMQTEVTRPRWALVVQLFNHGTHHRGQVHAMLTAAGARPEDTDVPFMSATHYEWE